MKNPHRKLILGALMASAICILTMSIRIPVPAGGYLNTGDAAVILASCMFSPAYSLLCGALGSALADVFSSYVIYAPATAIIKGAAAFIASAVYRRSKKRGILSCVVASVSCEAIVVLGYLLYEAFVLGFGAAALPGAMLNCIQGAVCTVIACMLVLVFTKNKILNKYFDL